ncbi:adenine phosphoribosyltransferase [Cryomorpha ignava]|uniref:Adenine phosphoribosyltransferase n=1 Tax=Cryomorpha ignava TaxID=101383 RepID=A0A7K3WPA3_9FLAO|nr:adenine phosphoribosyltransferase [Cryomorpha ignava]NEN22851.1 adenine phosphoribosyltransferase [Cryomorpha ignava]
MDVNVAIRNTIRTIPDFPKPGIQFKDITPILENPVVSRAIVAEFVKLYHGVKVDAVAGVESRGFLFGLPLAMELNVPFIIVRKKGKLPAETVNFKYDLEYGSAEIEVHKGAIKKGMNVLVHDDLLATGGTAGAAAQLIEKEEGIVAGFSFLIELDDLKGREKLVRFDKPIISLVRYN